MFHARSTQDGHRHSTFSLRDILKKIIKEIHEINYIRREIINGIPKIKHIMGMDPIRSNK